MPDFEIFGDTFFADPYPTFAAMRRRAPCWYDARLGAYLVTRYQDVAYVLKDSEQFSAGRVTQFGRGAPEHLRAKLDVYTRELEHWLLFSDPPAHTVLRRRISRAFGARLKPLIERGAGEAVATSIAALRSTEAPDLVRDFSYPVPTKVLAGILGIPSGDIDLFKRWTLDIIALIGAGVADERSIELGYRGVTELRPYVLDLIRERRGRPGEDMLSDLAARHNEADGSEVSDDDIVGIFMTLIVAGHETSTNLLANSLYHTLSDPRARAWVAANDGVSEAAVDELVRYDGPIFSMIRRARRDLDVAGTLVREGQYLFAMLHGANRDPEQFPDPDRLDFDRPRPAHLGFGIGPHACVGAAMARTVVSTALTEFFRAFPDAALAPSAAWQRNMALRGFAQLPARLQPAARPQPPPAPPGGHEGSPLHHPDPLADPLPDLAESGPRRVGSIVLAANTLAVRDVVLDANAQGVPIYPVSTGKNWGFGSRSPVVDGAVLLDLSTMNRVRELDLDRGIAVVEPGVTQGALSDRLAGTPFMLNVTTSCRDTSVLGNALDRGQGTLRLRIDELLGLEVVLGNGAIVTTGGTGRGDELTFFGQGSGPDATRLFCQSNFGVATAAAIALVPRPERTGYVYATFAGGAMAAAIDRLARLRREGVIEHIFYVAEMPLAPGESGQPNFTVLGPVLGRRRLVDQALAIVHDELSAVPGCRSVRSGDAEQVAPDDPIYYRVLTFLGVPSCEGLRLRMGTPTCALDETSPVRMCTLQALVPFEGRAVRGALDILQAGADASRMVVQPHFSSVTPRSLNLMIAICFSREPDTVERMRALRDDLQAKLLAGGFHHSREGIDPLRDAMTARTRDEAWAQIKRAFDPKGVIAPGRYVFTGDRVLDANRLAPHAAAPRE
jgi:4-cresol dehydrogenase (hydroxylating) flavoprotein subunit